MNFIKNKEKKQFYQLLKKVLSFYFTNSSNTLRQNKIQILLKMNMFSIQQIWTCKFSDTIWHPFQPDGSKCWHWHMLIKCVFSTHNFYLHQLKCHQKHVLYDGCWILSKTNLFSIYVINSMLFLSEASWINKKAEIKVY